MTLTPVSALQPALTRQVPMQVLDQLSDMTGEACFPDVIKRCKGLPLLSQQRPTASPAAPKQLSLQKQVELFKVVDDFTWNMQRRVFGSMGLSLLAPETLRVCTFHDLDSAHLNNYWNLVISTKIARVCRST
jgi:hypothetical protein